MNLIPTPTQLDIGILAGAEAANHFAAVLSNQWQAFWNRDTDTILAELNSDPRAATVFALNSQAAATVNALLDSIGSPKYSNRAPTSMPAGWAFDGSIFSYTAPEPEPES